MGIFGIKNGIALNSHTCEMCNVQVRNTVKNLLQKVKMGTQETIQELFLIYGENCPLRFHILAPTSTILKCPAPL